MKNTAYTRKYGVLECRCLRCVDVFPATYCILMFDFENIIAVWIEMSFCATMFFKCY